MLYCKEKKEKKQLWYVSNSKQGWVRFSSNIKKKNHLAMAAESNLSSIKVQTKGFNLKLYNNMKLFAGEVFRYKYKRYAYK